MANVDWADFEPLTGIPAFAKNNVPAYAENYTLAVERQVGANTMVSASYVGTQAHHLLVIQEVNPGNPALCLALSQPQEVAAGSATCGPFNESSTFVTTAGQSVAGTRTAYSSAFGSVNLQKTIANSHDNALELNVRHASRSLYLQLAYTWSRSIDESSSLAEAVYPGDAGLSRALSAFDMTHNFSATYRYAVPMGRLLRGGQRWTEGWEVSGLTRFGTGLPVTLVNNNDTSLLGTAPNGINNNGVDEPEFTPGNLEIDHRPGTNAFNTALFGLPALGTLGNARRRFFYGPGADNTDLAVAKKTTVREGMSVEVRAEAFNVLNSWAILRGECGEREYLQRELRERLQTCVPAAADAVSGTIHVLGVAPIMGASGVEGNHEGRGRSSGAAPGFVVGFEAMVFTRRSWRLFGELLLIGLVATSAMMLTIAEVHEHFRGARLMRLDSRIQDDVHGDTTPGLTRVMFALTDIGSPQVLLPAIPVLAGLLWWGRLRLRRGAAADCDGRCGVAGAGAEAALPAGEAGPAMGLCA